MSIFSAIGHALSTGYHDIFGGGQSDDQKKRQQQQQAAQRATQQAAAAERSNAPRNNNNQPQPAQPPSSQFSLTALQKVQPKPAVPGQPPVQPAQPKGVGGQPVVDANTLVKATSVPKPVAAQPQAPQKHASFIHDLTHNDITDIPKNAASAAAGASLATLRAGEGLVTGTASLPSAAAHLGDYLGKKLTGNQNFQDPLTKAIDSATKTVTSPVDWLAKKTDEASLAFGKPAQQVYKPVQVAANVATIVPGAEAALSKVPGVASKLGKVGDILDAQRGIPTLRKVIPGLPSAAPAANEVADGVSIVNANHDADVVAQSPSSPVNNPPEPTVPEVQPPVEPDLNTPAFMRAAEKPVAAPNPAEATTPLDKPAFQHKQDIQAVIQDGHDELNRFVEEHPDAAPHEIEAAKSAITSQVASSVQKLQEARAGVPAEAVPVRTPDVAPKELPQAPPVVAPTGPVPAETAVPTPSVPAEVAPVAPAAPVAAPADLLPAEGTPHAPGAPTRADAGQLREAAATNLKRLGANVDATGGVHDVVSNPELSKAGEDAVSHLSDQEVLDRFHGTPTFHGAADVAEGLGAMKRLAPLSQAGNPAADEAISNILDAASKEVSGGARTTNYAKEFYDNLPKPAKVKYLINNMDKVRSAFNEAHNLKPGDGKFLPMIGEDPALQKVVEANIDSFLTKDEAIRGTMADIENKVSANKEAIPNAAGRGELRGLSKDGLQLNKDYKAAGLALQKNTSEMGRYYDSVMPTRIATQTKLGDLGRTLMLSSPTGRANDVLTTGINSAHRLLTQIPETALGKVANVVGGNKGKYVSTLPSPRAVVRGVKFGLKKSSARFKGNVTSGDITSLTKADTGSGKGGLLSRGDNSRLGKITAPLHKVVRSATEIATDVSEGVKEAQVQRLASQQGKTLGYKGAELRAYTSNATAVPTKEMEEAGNHLRDEVNNMQDNPLTSGLESVSKGLAKIPVVGEQLKNLTLPFTRWTGGQMWNNLVDNNVLGNVVKAGRAAVKGDRQAVITNLSKLTVNATTAMTVGYQLAKAGVIVHGNAQGYNDDGAYLHVDGRYIPAGFLGFFAPGIILGSSTYEATSGKNAGKPVLQQVVDTAVNTLKNTAAASGAQTLTGENNPVVQALQDRSRNGDAATGAIIGGQVAGQYIPAGLNDANALANNGLKIGGKTIIPDSLNPTHEAALTKVEKGGLTPTGKKSTAKNIPATVVNQLLNKVPFASQKLPRNTGVAAADLVDRTVRGDRDTGAELQKKAVAAKAANVSADDQKKGIPDPTATYTQGDSFTNAVENRIENKKYDQAIQGLQQQLDIKQKGKDSTTKATQPIKDQIAQVKVLQAGNYDPAIRDTYKSTSLTEWRNLGDPNSDTYDPETYQKLFQYDSDLAKAGISGSSLKKTDNKYTAKTSKSGSGSGSGSSAERAALKKVTSNTLGTVPTLGNVSFGDLAPKKITDANAVIPTIQDIQPSQLIKKRTISVSKA